jgi:hypothetical protein
MLIFSTTVRELVTSALTLIGIGVCIGYIARDIRVQKEG